MMIIEGSGVSVYIIAIESVVCARKLIEELPLGSNSPVQFLPFCVVGIIRPQLPAHRPASLELRLTLELCV